MRWTPTPADESHEERRTTRRRHDDEGLYPALSNGTPSWGRMVTVIGVPSVIALFLVWQISLWLPKIQAQEVEVQTDIQKSREALDRYLIKQDQMYRLLQRICSNTAKTDNDRQKCFD